MLWNCIRLIYMHVHCITYISEKGCCKNAFTEGWEWSGNPYCWWKGLQKGGHRDLCGRYHRGRGCIQVGRIFALKREKDWMLVYIVWERDLDVMINFYTCTVKHRGNIKKRKERIMIQPWRKSVPTLYNRHGEREEERERECVHTYYNHSIQRKEGSLIPIVECCYHEHQYSKYYWYTVLQVFSAVVYFLRFFYGYEKCAEINYLFK